MNENLKQKILSFDWKIPPQENFNLKKLTTFRMGGPCKLLLSLSDIREASAAFSFVESTKIPWLVLGKGSNTIFTDRGFAGILFLLKGEFQSIKSKNPERICVGCGLANSKLAAYARKKDWGGLDFLATIPGTVGGGLFMNAGAYGTEFKDCLLSAEFMDAQGQTRTLKPKNLNFSYRHSSLFKKKGIVLFADLAIHETAPQTVEKNQSVMIAQRKKTQPVKTKNWGSVFKNPDGLSAGKLIESCGLKGKGFGAAKISEKHANFIENHGDAKFEDTLKTILLAKNTVKEKFSVDLIPEVRIISENGEIISPESFMK